MSDIVERLRNTRWQGSDSGALMLEASDEIERLTAELAQLRVAYAKLYDSTERRERDELIAEVVRLRVNVAAQQAAFVEFSTTLEAWSDKHKRTFDEMTHPERDQLQDQNMQQQVEMIKSLEDNKELRAELATLQKNAERWQFIQSQMMHRRCGPNIGWTLGELYIGDDPDSAIDSNRRALEAKL